MLPPFRYHPDPLATGSVKTSDAACVCCGRARGYVYAASVYSPDDLREKLCPWCIASGAAASRFDCFFTDDRPLRQARLPAPVVLEVSRKTPGYNSWQQGVWQVCCDDACAFHGEATKDDLAVLTGDRLALHLHRWPGDADGWRRFVEAYEPGGVMPVFRFVCLHCGEPTYALDMP